MILVENTWPLAGLGNEEITVMRAEITVRKHEALRAKKKEVEPVILVEKHRVS